MGRHRHDVRRRQHHGDGLSLPGTANIGGNAGAFADGFTSAPDSFGVSINHTNGQVIVNLDDRISGLNPGLMTLFTAQGLPIAIAPTSESFNSSAGPGPLAVTLQYSPSGITNATALQLRAGRVHRTVPEHRHVHDGVQRNSG